MYLKAYANHLPGVQVMATINLRGGKQPETGQVNCSSQSIPKKQKHKNIRTHFVLSIK